MTPLSLALVATAAAQSMAGMPGMTMPAATSSHHVGHHGAPGKAAAAKVSAAPSPDAAPAPRQQGATSASSPAAAGQPPMPGMVTDAAERDFLTAGMAPAGTALAPGDAPPPPVPTDHYADRAFPVGEMAVARRQMMRDQGDQRFHQVMVNLAEAQFHDGRDGYRWDGEAWFGGDLDRGWIKSEGSGGFRGGVDAAEIQALYSRAVGPYVDLQGGVRHDFAPRPTRTYASIGAEGLAPYLVQVEARGFVATTGQVLGRLEGWYDQRLTQRLVLQPRAELNLAAQDDAPMRTGAGLSDAEIGLRLRYEIVREVAPYIGVSYEAKTGRSADYARADGKRPTQTSLVAGVRFWF